MSLPTLTPTSTQSAIILPVTGNTDNVADACPMGTYTGSVEFVIGAVKQVKFTYKRLGGDVLDIELTEQNIYANYEEACLEYSYIINQHQAKNVIGSALGSTTGSFDHQGQTTEGPDGYQLKYPRFSFETSFRIGDSFATEAGIGGSTPMYSASVTTVAGQQDYDLQSIVSASATEGTELFSSALGNNKIKIRKMYYISPQQMWRFYGYYGGLNVVGDFHNYGQYADDSSFQVIPAWHNKLQAMSYEDHLYTRTSHYSYEIINNNLRLYPIPSGVSPDKFWFKFTIENGDIWSNDGAGVDGVNNINTIPFENLPYENINSMGKQWIRRYSLALSKETLGQIRGKFGGSIPIPGDNISLNAADLLGQAKEEQDKLKEELRKVLEETEYSKLIAADKEMTDNAVGVMNEAPMGIFVG